MIYLKKKKRAKPAPGSSTLFRAIRAVSTEARKQPKKINADEDKSVNNPVQNPAIIISPNGADVVVDEVVV